jgi:hypothetical protein
MAAVLAGPTPRNGSTPFIRSAKRPAASGSPLAAAKSARALASLSGKLQR